MRQRGMVTVKEAARYWGVNPETIKRRCQSGLTEARKAGRDWRIPIDSLDTFFDGPEKRGQELLDRAQKNMARL